MEPEPEEEGASRWERLWDVILVHCIGPAIEATVFLTVAHFWPEATKWTLALLIVIAGAHIHILNATLRNVNDALDVLKNNYNVALLALQEARCRAGEAEYLLAKKRAEEKGEKVRIE